MGEVGAAWAKAVGAGGGAVFAGVGALLVRSAVRRGQVDVFLVGFAGYIAVGVAALCAALAAVGPVHTALAIAALEALHVVVHAPRAARPQLRKDHKPSPPPAELTPLRIIDHFLELAEEGVFELKDFFSEWFYGADFDDISRDSAHELSAYGFFYSRFGDLPASEQELIRTNVDKIERIMDRKFPTHGAKLPFIQHIWEPVTAVYQPFCVRLMTTLFNLIAYAFLTAWGFQRRTHNSVSFWIREAAPPPAGARRPLVAPEAKTAAAEGAAEGAEGAGARAPPLLFFHGVGMGLIMYLPLVRNVMARLRGTGCARDVILLDMPHVSMRWTAHIPTFDNIADDVAEMVALMGYGRVDVAGHSYGSFCCARIIQKYPALVRSSLLIDPVCFLLILPNIVSNFLIKGARNPFTHSVSTFLRDFVRIFFCSREEGIAYTFSRNFYWHQVCLWMNEIPARTTVVLSSEDELVPGKELMRYLTREKNREDFPGKQPRTIWLDGQNHAGFLGHPRLLREMASEMTPVAP